MFVQDPSGIWGYMWAQEPAALSWAQKVSSLANPGVRPGALRQNLDHVARLIGSMCMEYFPHGTGLQGTEMCMLLEFLNSFFNCRSRTAVSTEFTTSPWSMLWLMWALYSNCWYQNWHNTKINDIIRTDVARQEYWYQILPFGPLHMSRFFPGIDMIQYDPGQ